MSETLERFLAAWSEPDRAARRLLLEPCIAPGGFYYVDPQHGDPVTDLDGLLAVTDIFGTNLEGGHFALRGVTTHNGHLRATVDVMRGEVRIMRTQLFADLDDAGRLARAVGFLGTED